MHLAAAVAQVVVVVGGMIGVVEEVREIINVQMIPGYITEPVFQISVNTRIGACLILPVPLLLPVL